MNEPKGGGSGGDRLIEESLGLARGLAWKFSRSRPWLFEDFVSAANLGLVKAARAFDADRGVAFHVFAYKWVVNAIRDEARDLLDGGFKGRFEDRPRFDSFSDELHELVDPHDDLDVVLTADHFASRLARLPGRLKSLFRLLYCEGRTGRQASRVLGISPAGVSRLNRRLMERLNEFKLNGGLSEALGSRLEATVAAA